MTRSFHSPGRPEDLPDPTVVWGLGAMAVALGAGIRAPWSERWRLADDSLYMEGGGGDWWRLARVEGGRFLLLGWDRVSDTDCSVELPFDLFADAPDWMPWSWVEKAAREPAIGFAYWWDGGWGRAPYPDSVDEDGLDIMLSSFVSVEGIVKCLVNLVEGGRRTKVDGGGEGPLEGDELAELLRVLAVAATAGRVGADDLVPLARGLGEGFDPAAAMDVLRRAGLTAGEPDPAVPEVPAGSGRPVGRPGPWAISLGAWGYVVASAMCAARERDRPAPQETEELRRLCDTLREMAEERGREVTHTLTCLEQATRSLLVDALGTSMDEPGPLAELSFDLRRAERHPERGIWLFLRIRATPDTVEIDRAYDRWPEWDQKRYSVGGEAQLSGLRAEMGRRAPEWRPSWARLLDDRLSFDPPVDPFAEPDHV